MRQYSTDRDRLCWVANNDCEGGRYPQCPTCPAFCGDTSSQDVDRDAQPDCKPKDEARSDSTKRGANLERRFRRACRTRGWIVVRANALATYLLHPDWIPGNRELHKLKKLLSTIPYQQVRSLSKLCRRHEAFNLYGPFAVVRGLPDFVVWRGQRDIHPLFVEVKCGKTGLSKQQRDWVERLTDLGLEARVWRGGDLPEA